MHATTKNYAQLSVVFIPAQQVLTESADWIMSKNGKEEQMDIFRACLDLSLVSG